MTSRKFEFEGASGETLVGRVDLPPDGETVAHALFAHCFTCSKDLKAATNLARALNEQRIGVFRFDFTGLGESEGDFADTDFSSNVADLVAAAGFMEREMAGPRVLVGHSLGGAAVLQAASRIPSSRAVATVAAPAHPEHVKRNFGASLDEIRERGEAEVTLAGRTFTIRKQFLDDLEETRMEATVRDLDRALLIFHSPVDEIVGIDNAARLYEWAKHPKSFVSLDRADHLMRDEADSRYAGAVLGAWARKYIDAGPRSEGEVREEGEEGEDREARGEGEGPESEEGRVVARLAGSGYRTDVMAGGHSLVSDEPESVGGTDRGPSPYDLVSAALGACTAMTLRMYADRKEWPLEEVTVRLDHGKVHAEDRETCPGEDGEARSKIDRFEREISVEGELDREQRERLLEIADRCPVSRTLKARSELTSRLSGN